MMNEQAKVAFWYGLALGILFSFLFVVSPIIAKSISLASGEVMSWTFTIGTDLRGPTLGIKALVIGGLVMLIAAVLWFTPRVWQSNDEKA